MAKKQENIQPRDTYQTGMTDPPRKRGGLIAGLCMAVIFLCGIVTGLSAMNIQLFRQINSGHEQTKSVTFTRKDGVSAAAYSEGWQITEEAFWELGFVGRELTAVYRNYYALPQGIYISQVDSSSRLGLLGLQPGDVLLQVNDKPITCLEDAREALAGLQTGVLILYRAGQTFTIIY